MVQKIRLTRRSKKYYEQLFWKRVGILPVTEIMERSRKNVILLWEKPKKNLSLTVKCQGGFIVNSDFHSTFTAGSQIGRKRRPTKTLHAWVGRGIWIDFFFPNIFHRTLISRDGHKYYVKKEFFFVKYLWKLWVKLH